MPSVRYEKSGAVGHIILCDFIVAAQDAIFRQIEVSRGNMPMACSGWRNGSAAHVRCSTRCSRFR
jgi:enoyl-CoA hydratase/carnithine racemase